MTLQRLMITAIRIVSVVVLTGILTGLFVGVASAHSTQQVAITGYNCIPTIPANLPSNTTQAAQQIPASTLCTSQQAYNQAQQTPANENVEDHNNVFIPGVGTITVRIYAIVGPLTFIPVGIGVFMPQTTASNLQKTNVAIATAIAVAIVHANPHLAPFAGLIGVLVGNYLNTFPNYIIETCGTQGGGFTANFIAFVPVPYCGPLPTWPL